MSKTRTIWLMAGIVGILTTCGTTLAALPSVADGYGIEAYVGGLQNVNSIAFSPGGEFGYEGQLFVGDARPDRGTIYRVPSKGEKVFFANAGDDEPRTCEFAPLGSQFVSGLYMCEDYYIRRYDSTGSMSVFARVNAFGWDLAFGNGIWGDVLYHADGWGEEIHMWSPAGVQGLLVGGLPEETSGLAFGPGLAWGEYLYVAFASSRGSLPCVRRITTDGVISDFVVCPDFKQTNQLAFDIGGLFGGNLFVSDSGSDAIFLITPVGEVSVFATGFSFSGTPYHQNDGGDLVFGPDGCLYVADGGAGVVWRIFALTPMEVSIGKLQRTITEKQALLEKTESLLGGEVETYEILQGMLATGDYGACEKGDIIKALGKLHAAMQHEQQTIDALNKSIEKLLDALAALGWVPDATAGE